MTDTRYKIVFEGQLMPDQSLDTVKANLARLFRSDQAKIDVLFTGGPVALKRDLSEAEADKYLGALQQAGAQVRKEQDLAAKLSLVDIEQEAVSNESMDCPKCGTQQPKAVACASCGIVIEKYLTRQAQIAQNPPEPIANASPYGTPKSDVGESMPEHGRLKVFTTDGRIGRLRYLGWSMALLLLAMVAYLIAAGAMAVSPIVGGILMIPVVIGTVVISVMIGVQRLHDIGWSGWLWLLNLVPLIGSIFALLMLVVPGSQSANRYGPPPPPNSPGVIAMAWGGLVLWLVATVGILAAVAIPAYQDYVERAQQSQSLQYTPEGEE